MTTLININITVQEITDKNSKFYESDTKIPYIISVTIRCTAVHSWNININLNINVNVNMLGPYDYNSLVGSVWEAMRFESLLSLCRKPTECYQNSRTGYFIMQWIIMMHYVVSLHDILFLYCNQIVIHTDCEYLTTVS